MKRIEIIWSFSLFNRQTVGIVYRMVGGGKGGIKITYTHIHIIFFLILTNGVVAALGEKKVVFEFEMNKNGKKR